MTFRERFFNGEAPFEEIFDLTDQWNSSDDTRPLREYLGLTAEEEDIWISESDEALEDFMNAEKKRKIFFTDLDGTLFDDQKALTPRNREALNQLLESGHVLVLCTGRTLTGTLNQAESLGLLGENCYIACYNGATIYDIKQKKQIVRKGLPLDAVRFAFDQARKFGIDMQTYAETDLVITEQDNASTRTYVQTQNLDYKAVPDVIEALREYNPSKVLALDYENHDRILSFREYLAPKCAGKFDLFLSDPALLELVPCGVNKGAAVHFLCEYLGIPESNCIAAGDEENDLSMIQRAKVGCAMSNAAELLKKSADYVTAADNNHDGIAEIIYKFVL